MRGGGRGMPAVTLECRAPGAGRHSHPQLPPAPLAPALPTPPIIPLPLRHQDALGESSGKLESAGGMGSAEVEHSPGGWRWRYVEGVRVCGCEVGA